MCQQDKTKKREDIIKNTKAKQPEDSKSRTGSQ